MGFSTDPRPTNTDNHILAYGSDGLVYEIRETLGGRFAQPVGKHFLQKVKERPQLSWNRRLARRNEGKETRSGWGVRADFTDLSVEERIANS